jgi:hypothetical protein
VKEAMSATLRCASSFRLLGSPSAGISGGKPMYSQTIAVLVLTMLLLVPTPAPAGQDTPKQTAPQESRQSWWFPSSMPVGGRYEYRVVYTMEVPEREDLLPTRIETDFALVVAEEKGKAGRVVRLVPPDVTGESVTWLATWLNSVARVNPQGVRVTTDGVWLKDEPLLRGPWRRGDRLTFGGVVLFFVPFASLLHAEVVSADAGHARLVFDFWGGRPMPEASGSGELRLTSDADSLTSLDLKWTWEFGTTKLESRIEVTRNRIVRPEQGTTGRSASGQPVP